MLGSDERASLVWGSSNDAKNKVIMASFPGFESSQHEHRRISLTKINELKCDVIFVAKYNYKLDRFAAKNTVFL